VSFVPAPADPRPVPPATFPRCAPILESPFAEDNGQHCDGHAGAVARYAVWTDEPTGDPYRLSCGECLPGWVNAVTVRLRVEGATPAPLVRLASCGHAANDDGECGCSSWPERASLAALTGGGDA
jgi:hypothetical protein